MTVVKGGGGTVVTDGGADDVAGAEVVSWTSVVVVDEDAAVSRMTVLVSIVVVGVGVSVDVSSNVVVGKEKVVEGPNVGEGARVPTIWPVHAALSKQYPLQQYGYSLVQ